MRSSPPTAPLLEAAAATIEASVAGASGPENGYETRIALNLVKMAAREARDAPANDHEERARLQVLLASAETDLARLNRMLAARIRSGAIAIDAAQTVAHLAASATAALAVENPSYLKQRLALTPHDYP